MVGKEPLRVGALEFAPSTVQASQLPLEPLLMSLLTLDGLTSTALYANVPIAG